ncbi:MAG: Si-specific NAD(P)(+) transhydrogenase [Candidatus Acidiferrales bacterium]
MAETRNYDLVVIGSGPAGEKAAAQAAYFGKKVALIEKASVMGGACVGTGTIPSKTLRESALYYSGVNARGLFGKDYSLKETLSVKDFMFRKDYVVALEQERVLKNMEAHHVDIYWGTGGFVDPHTVVATGAPGNPVLRGEFILIATGSRPARDPSVPYDDKYIFDSDSILYMDRIPKSMAVIGGGVIGSEYASIFTAIGVRVSLVDGRDRLLPFLDAEISERLRSQLASLDLQFTFKERIAKCERTSDGVRLTLTSGKTVEAETVLFAAGRNGVVKELNLDKIGLTLNKRGHIDINENYQTAVPHIYAAGDVIGFPALASTSMEQGRIAACHAFNISYKKRLAHMLPMGIYTIPEISAVGESEESCKEKKIDYVAGRAQFKNNTRGQILGDTHGMLKLIFRRDNKELLGVHVIGEGATELIHLGMDVLESGGTIDRFIELVFNFPTLSETYKYAAYDGLGNLAGHKLREG